MSAPNLQTILRRARRCGLRLVAAVVTVIMLVGVLRAGASYFYCPEMGSVAPAPCCSHGSGSHDETGAAELRGAGCCEEHVLAGLPSAATASVTPDLLSAPLVAVLPALSAMVPELGAPPEGRFAYDGRAGPTAIALARHRAELMVSLN